MWAPALVRPRQELLGLDESGSWITQPLLPFVVLFPSLLELCMYCLKPSLYEIFFINNMEYTRIYMDHTVGAAKRHLFVKLKF